MTIYYIENAANGGGQASSDGSQSKPFLLEEAIAFTGLQNYDEFAIGPGTHLSSSSWSPGNRVRVRGQGPELTTIAFTGSNDEAFIDSPGGNTYWSGFKVDGQNNAVRACDIGDNLVRLYDIHVANCDASFWDMAFGGSSGSVDRLLVDSNDLPNKAGPFLTGIGVTNSLFRGPRDTKFGRCTVANNIFLGGKILIRGGGSFYNNCVASPYGDGMDINPASGTNQFYGPSEVVGLIVSEGQQFGVDQNSSEAFVKGAFIDASQGIATGNFASTVEAESLTAAIFVDAANSDFRLTDYGKSLPGVKAIMAGLQYVPDITIDPLEDLLGGPPAAFNPFRSPQLRRGP